VATLSALALVVGACSQWANTRIYDAAAEAREFCVAIRPTPWYHKPYAEAVLASRGHACLKEVDQDMWWIKSGVITWEQYVCVLDELWDGGFELRHGRYRPRAPTFEYFVEIEADNKLYHASLGFNRGTVELLSGIVVALDPDNGAVVMAVVAGIPSFGFGGKRAKCARSAARGP